MEKMYTVFIYSLRLLLSTFIQKKYFFAWNLSLSSPGAVHTPSTAFRHLPPNSARFGYATEGALFISAQLSTDAVSAFRK